MSLSEKCRVGPQFIEGHDPDADPNLDEPNAWEVPCRAGWYKTATVIRPYRQRVTGMFVRIPLLMCHYSISAM